MALKILPGSDLSYIIDLGVDRDVVAEDEKREFFVLSPHTFD